MIERISEKEVLLCHCPKEASGSTQSCLENVPEAIKQIKHRQKRLKLLWFLSRGFITFKKQKTQSLSPRSWTVHHSSYRTPRQHSWYINWIPQGKVHAITSSNPGILTLRLSGWVGMGLLADPNCWWHEITVAGVVQFPAEQKELMHWALPWPIKPFTCQPFLRFSITSAKISSL